MKRPLEQISVGFLPKLMWWQFNGLESLRISETRRSIYSSYFVEVFLIQGSAMVESLQ